VKRRSIETAASPYQREYPVIPVCVVKSFRFLLSVCLGSVVALGSTKAETRVMVVDPLSGKLLGEISGLEERAVAELMSALAKRPAPTTKRPAFPTWAKGSKSGH
jgi:hypothetical protein